MFIREKPLTDSPPYSTGIIVLMLCAIFAGGASVARDQGAPPTPVGQVTNTYHGVTVSDPYRWLEDHSDARVQDWEAAQDERTRTYLDSLPVRKPVFAQLLQQTQAASKRFYDIYATGNQVFAMLNDPAKQQPMLVVMGNDADPAGARVVLDPNRLSAAGATAIDWFVPSVDGKFVAVSLSDNGSEDGSLHVVDVATGRQTGEVIPRVQYPTGGGSLAWRADGSGFWYTRYPGPDRPDAEQHFFQRVYYHRVGDDAGKDLCVLGKDFPKVAEISLNNRRDPREVLVTVANGDGGEYAHYVIAPDQSTRQITRFEDRIVGATIGPDGTVYLTSRKDAPHGKLLALAPDDLRLDRATVVIPESAAVIQPGGEFGGEPVVVTADTIYVRELVGGPSRVALFDHAGKPQGLLPLPDVATVSEVEPVGDGTVLYSIETYLRPPYFSRFDPVSRRSTETTLAQTTPVSFDDTEVIRDFAPSKDGTSIPVNIVRRKDTKLDGTNPVLLTGYGGYGISERPNFLGPSTRLWLDAGGVFVIANLRGGGEFGEAWHAAGALTHKQHVFDDFIGAARLLIRRHYTSPAHLAVLGGSNGGLLMGAVLTQQPQLFRAVVSLVGIYDMLRVELDPNGAFNTTEFGSVSDHAQFEALYAYSPYHHVRDGTKYPAVFMATGSTDGRVNPAHSRKMIARLQAATASGHPVLLSINSHAGHGIGSSLSIRVNQSADRFAFLIDQLGMHFPPAEPR